MSSVANGCVCRRCWFMPGIPPGAKICAERPSSSLEALPLLPRPGATFPRVPLARGYPRGALGKAAACSVSQAIQGSVLQPGLPAWPRSQLGSSPLTAEGTAEKASASACGSLPRSLLVAPCLKHPAETPPWLPGAFVGSAVQPPSGWKAPTHPEASRDNSPRFLTLASNDLRVGSEVALLWLCLWTSSS